MATLRGLGRGLDALLGGNDNRDVDWLTQLAVGLLRPHCFQLRTRMDPQSLAELAASTKTQSEIHPIRVRPVDGGRCETIAGERRWRAPLADLTHAPVVIRAIPDRTALAKTLIENIQREDRNLLDKVADIQRLIDEFDTTHDVVPPAVDRSRSAVTNLLQLMPRQAGPRDDDKTSGAMILAGLETQHELDMWGEWPLGYEGVFASFDEHLEVANNRPLSYEAACAWLEKSLDEVAPDLRLDFDAACEWLENTSKNGCLTS